MSFEIQERNWRGNQSDFEVISQTSNFEVKQFPLVAGLLGTAYPLERGEVALVVDTPEGQKIDRCGAKAAIANAKRNTYFVHYNQETPSGKKELTVVIGTGFRVATKKFAGTLANYQVGDLVVGLKDTDDNDKGKIYRIQDFTVLDKDWDHVAIARVSADADGLYTKANGWLVLEVL